MSALGAAPAPRRRRALRPLRRADVRGSPPPAATSASAGSSAPASRAVAMRTGEDDLRPTGTRTLRLEDFTLSDELWAQFQIPIGLAFFFVSEVPDGVVALYPSPAGATECELYLDGVERTGSGQPDPRRPRARGRGADRQSARRPAGPRDRADRPLLRAGGDDQGQLGGDLRRGRRPERGRGVLRAAARRPERGMTARHCSPIVTVCFRRSPRDDGEAETVCSAEASR